MSVHHRKCEERIVKFHKNNTKKIERNHCHFVESGEAHLMVTTAHFWFEELFLKSGNVPP